MNVCRRPRCCAAAVALVCALAAVAAAADGEGALDCCAVRHVRARQPRFCAFAADALMCSADGAGAACRAINNFGIGVGAGFASDYVALAQEDAGCADQLLAFHCAQRCGDCVRSSSSATFVHRRACLEFVFFFPFPESLLLSRLLFFSAAERARLFAPRARHSQPTRCTTRPSCATTPRCSRAPAASASTSLPPTRSTPRSPWASSASGSLSSSSSWFSPLWQIAMLGTLAKLTSLCNVSFDCTFHFLSDSFFDE